MCGITQTWATYGPGPARETILGGPAGTCRNTYRNTLTVKKAEEFFLFYSSLIFSVTNIGHVKTCILFFAFPSNAALILADV